MEAWDNIIHTALLGTDKKAIKKEELPGDMADVYDLVTAIDDREEQYLRIAGIAFNYRKCGHIPLHKTVAYSVAQDETKAYANATSHQVLTSALSSESYALLELWLRECSNKSLLVQPEFLPVLFTLSLRQKALQSLILSVAGKRGEWLLSLNDDWKIKAITIGETIWQTGTLDERKIYLNNLRKEDAAKGRELLQQTWAQENANTKAELLKQLSVSIGDEDNSWLEQLLADKSQKVKDEAIKLLKRLPQSSIVQQYWNIVTQAIHIKKEKGFLGLGNKTSLEIVLPKQIDEAIFKTGIEKVSSNKNESDEDFILYQLVSAVPPSFFERKYEITKQALPDLFSQSKKGKLLLPAFGIAAMHFREEDWVKAIIAMPDNTFYPDVFKLLNKEEQETYALSFLKKNEHEYSVIDQLKKYGVGEWSVMLTKAVFRYTAKNSYSFNPAFYNSIILFIPINIIPELEKCTPPEEYMRNQWSKTSDYIIQLLTLRTQIVQAFQA